MEATEAARFEVQGRVQGVGYRFFVYAAAQSLQLCGWVRNRPDASVEVAARGPAGQLRQLEQQLWQGPPAANVLAVRRLPWSLPPGGSYPRRFDIRRG